MLCIARRRRRLRLREYDANAENRRCLLAAAVRKQRNALRPFPKFLPLLRLHLRAVRPDNAMELPTNDSLMISRSEDGDVADFPRTQQQWGNIGK